MKTLIQFIKERLIIFPSQVDEKLVVNQRFDERLIINKDYNYDVDFYNNFKEDIDSLFKDNFFREIPDIGLCMYPKSRWSEGLRRDITYVFNRYGTKKIRVIKVLLGNIVPILQMKKHVRFGKNL